MSSLTGWGRQSWGSGAWNEAGPVEPTGVAITSALGTLTTSVSNIGEPAGVQITSAVSAPTANIGTNVNPTGVQFLAVAGNMFLWFPIDTDQTPNYTPIER